MVIDISLKDDRALPHYFLSLYNVDVVEVLLLAEVSPFNLDLTSKK
jgi:hypothetical protein